MDAHGVEDIRKHVRTYVVVFVALAALTCITVAVSYLHLKPVAAIAVALVIASLKASLVAMFFMHLISERSVIYWTLALCAVLFVALLILPGLTQGEQEIWMQGIQKHVP